MRLMQNNKNQAARLWQEISPALIGCLILFFADQLLAQAPAGENPEKAGPAFEGAGVEYTSESFRDPLRPPIIRPKAEEAEAQVTIEEKKPREARLVSLSLQGIIWSPKLPLAIINNRVVKMGDVILVPKDRELTEAVTIMDITQDGVVIIYSGVVEKIPSPASLELRNIKGGLR